ncbi:hypothetical protein PVK06_040593 [Gossypium arboreum]|uniref:Uncharacterized protein n=1 Tax=Gossypium arboreum TaxID=29729 RepID=A0ABR0N8Q2_GOSAR|nr:hypothetical protein PVK06_040593 [Gossypium arboreum]
MNPFTQYFYDHLLQVHEQERSSSSSDPSQSLPPCDGTPHASGYTMPATEYNLQANDSVEHVLDAQMKNHNDEQDVSPNQAEVIFHFGSIMLILKINFEQPLKRLYSQMFTIIAISILMLSNNLLITTQGVDGTGVESNAMAARRSQLVEVFEFAFAGNGEFAIWGLENICKTELETDNEPATSDLKLKTMIS